jgi:hypothetical protein
MVVYAVDSATGAWFFAETEQSDGEAPFTLGVQPGAYQVFAFADGGPYAGYSEDGWTLTTVTVAAGQTVADIVVRPPSQNECGATFGLPASPDGRFAAIPGPSPDCQAGEQGAASGGPQLLPLNADECRDLADATAQTLAVNVTSSDVAVERSWYEQQGTACQVTASGNGLNFDDIIVAHDGLRAILEARGWVEQTQAPMCLGHGGWGPGATTACFAQADKVCEAFVYVEPSDMALCSGIEGPIGVCLSQLAPEQKIYTATLTCAQGVAAEAVPAPKTEPARLQFAAGATSAQVAGSLAAGELYPYVLNAGAGQEMTVNLYATSGESPAPGSVILVIWGLDGTVLISDHADADTWTGVLPVTQDYYVDVRSVVHIPVDYVLEVIIPPAGGSGNTAGPEPLPVDVPVGFEHLFGLSEPLMLPPDFPVGEGQPAVQPYVVTAETGEIEISLDYGPECQGAGACHYGSLAVKKVDSTTPVGTRNYPYEAGRAQMVTLAQGIQGYFVESTCGANCNDALLFWIYNGYQYMLGLKAGPQADVVKLADAAIENSLSVTGAPSGGLEPLDPATCGELADALAGALGVPATTALASFEDHVRNQTGNSCQIAANGSGLNFENILVVQDALVGVLQARGWVEDVQYQGGGPGAFLTGYRQGDALCLALAYWEPSDDANCPSDQPLGACDLAPEQKLYTITLDCVK